MAENEKPRVCPVPCVRRLPLYLAYLRSLPKTDEVISSTRIAQELGFTGIQVRKDLATTGIVGRPKVGHRICALVDHLEAFLGWNNTSEALLIGAGHLGMALMGYRGFQRDGLRILAAFDSDLSKIGTRVHGLEIFPLEKFEDLARRMHIRIGIITVPAEKAQEVADLMVRSGIVGIWNFAPSKLMVPDSVVVENVSLASSLAVLSQKLTRKK